MKNTLSTSQAAEMLLQDENASWTRAGALALCDYLEQCEEDCDTEIDFDVVGIRCDYSEYESLQDWVAEYYGFDLETSMGHAGIDLDGNEDDYELDELIRSHIRDHGQLIEFSGGIIVSSF